MTSDPVVHDLAVVGAGPAGMAAAVTAAAHGLDVVVVDEQRRAGGQIFRQPPPELGLPPTAPPGYRWGRDLLRAAEQAAVTWWFGSTVVGVLREPQGLRVAVHGADGTRSLLVRRLLIGTGALDLPVAFPGWTLPGVVMAGGAQTLLKSQRLLVADPVVLAGSHPLLILVADQLRAAGADVAEVAIARGVPTPWEALRALPAVPGHAGLLAGSAAALARLRRAGVRISTRTIVTQAWGAEQVEAVDLAPVDRRWRVTGDSRRVPARTLVLGYGFQASTELARQVGCRMVWDGPRGGWVVAHDETMATSVPGVYVAGEPAGVAGAEQSQAEGHRAGLAVVADLSSSAGRGRPVPPRDARRARRAVARTDRFARVVQRMFEPDRAGLAALATPSTVVCRCELVTRGTVDATLDANPHLSTAGALKLECRTGMGTCQGRYCEGTVTALVAGRRNLPMAQVGHFAAHLPVKPVPVSALAQLTAPQEPADPAPGR